MPHKQGDQTNKKWIQIPSSNIYKSGQYTEAIISGINKLDIVESSAHYRVPLPSSISLDEIASVDDQTDEQSPMIDANPLHGQKPFLQQESYGTLFSTERNFVNTATQVDFFKAPGNFIVDSSTYATAKMKAAFYPKFENEKSHEHVRIKIIEKVSNGEVALEVSLKHSGSLFMYAGREGGAYAKNSLGNKYTAVGVFVFDRTFRLAWGMEARKKQAEFSEFLVREQMSISMELVTAVLGDHGQQPYEDYVVVTAITKFGNQKPKFYSSPEIIAFCRIWRLPTNHIWLFFTRNSVKAFFAAYDALCEVGTATSVCKALDDIADISVPGSVDHIKVQGELLEGLVARTVSLVSIKQMELVLKDYPSPREEAFRDLGPDLREIFAANRPDEKELIKALLNNTSTSFCPDHLEWFGTEVAGVVPKNVDGLVVSKFLQAKPSDSTTAKLMEMVSLIREKFSSAVAFNCYHKINSMSNDNLHCKMAIHVRNDSAFQKYQTVMRYNPDLWPLYRGFFVEINLSKASQEEAAGLAKSSTDVGHNRKESDGTSIKGGLEDEDANLMIKLKFLKYKLRTFLIRNGVSFLVKGGLDRYREYYISQMEKWNTSPKKRTQLIEMLEEWAEYITKDGRHKQLSSSIYLSEAEPFLEQYAKRSLENLALIGCAGDLVRTEDLLAIVAGTKDEESDLETKKVPEPSSPDAVKKKEGLIVFFPGIPGCAKSALCDAILSIPRCLDDDRPIHRLMGDKIKRRYWQKIADELCIQPYSVVLADKNAPNEDVWEQIEDICATTKASAVPIVPDSEGTESNPFSLDALAVFLHRVLNRVDHPGNLHKSSSNVGNVLLMFYHLYDGRNHKEFESELIERFGSLVKMPLLKSERNPIPDSVKTVLEEGITLYQLDPNMNERSESIGRWKEWEKQLKDVLFRNAEYLTSIQVPFEIVVNQVMEQLKRIIKGEYVTATKEKSKFRTIVYAAIDVPLPDVHNLLSYISRNEPNVKSFLEDKKIEKNLKKAHITLAHKTSHGVTAVANYGHLVNENILVDVTALFFSDQLAALEAHLGSVDGQKISSKNQWPHLTLWTAKGILPKEANTLCDLFLLGKATRVEIDPPFRLSGLLQIH